MTLFVSGLGASPPVLISPTANAQIPTYFLAVTHSSTALSLDQINSTRIPKLAQKRHPHTPTCFDHAATEHLFSNGWTKIQGVLTGFNDFVGATQPGVRSGFAFSRGFPAYFWLSFPCFSFAITCTPPDRTQLETLNSSSCQHQHQLQHR